MKTVAEKLAKVSMASTLELREKELQAQNVELRLQGERLAAALGELRQREADLQEAAARRNEFIAMLGHELRNPLAAVATACLALGQRGAARNAARYRDIIQRQTSHLSRLVDDLLDLSRMTQGRIELRRQVVDLRPIVRRAAQSARPFIETAHHRLTVSVARRIVAAEVDATRIEQVLVNLLHNAAKYTPAGGHITLGLRGEQREAVLRVCDDGVGIAPALRERIFEPFVQGEGQPWPRASEGGLGIGLTLVRTLVERHGGRIEARSEGEGRGSEFIVRLPRAPAEVVALRADRPFEVRLPHRSLAILIVDDYLDTAESLADVLRIWGHDARVVGDGAAAIAVALAQPPDLILLDIGLPGMNGYDVAARLRREPTLAGTLIVAVTGYGQRADKERAIEAGCHAHLVKPVCPSDLLELLGGGPSLNEASRAASPM